jgi:DNA invertase Pin-like site-specific DNA recombinase
MTHAVVYDRASTKNQKDNYSRVNAHEVGIRIAEQNGFTWEYIKEIGSGTTLTGRPEMMKILDRIAAGEIQVIIVQDLDRLARPEEAIIYTTIRQVIMEYNVIIYTHTSRVDLNNDDDDFVADITMSVAKKERRRILKRMKRSIKAKADQGRYIGGTPGLGYKIVYQNGKDGDLAIDENEVETVKAVFDTLEATGGNIADAVKKLNEQGYTGKEGKLFVPASFRRIVPRKLYIGIFETKVTDKISHRPDLQIISVEQFKRVQELIKSRSGNKKDMGRRGHYIFTGFVICGNCRGATVAAASNDYIAYQCVNHRHYGKAACSSSKTYSEHLILPPIVEFLAGFIQSQIDFYTALDAAAAQYGKSITEEAIEAAIQGELASVQAGKQRLIEAISLGILTHQEAATELAKLREQEGRLTIELSSVAEKTAIMAQWQDALDSLKGHDITGRLKELAEQKPIAFRRLLSIVFEPNSLKVRTERKGSKWIGMLEDYKLTEVMQNMSISFETNPGSVVSKDTTLFELAELLI